MTKVVLDMSIKEASQEIKSRLAAGGETPFTDPIEAVAWFASKAGWTPQDEATRVAEVAQKNGRSWNDEFFSYLK